MDPVPGNLLESASHGQAPQETDLQALLEENRQLKSDLEGCASAAFMQLRENRLSDASIQRDYAAICEAIETWMDSMFAETKDGNVKKHQRQILRYDREQARFLRNRISGDIDLYKVIESEYSDYYFLSIVVMSILEDEIFTMSYPIGTPTLYKNFISKFEQDMASLHEDVSSFDNWRSDTLSTLIATSDFKDGRTRAIDRILYKAQKSIVSWLLPGYAFAENEDYFRKDIIEPAVNLHQDMESSVERYRFIKPRIPSGSDAEYFRASSWAFKDIWSWRMVGTHDVVIGLSTLYPGIERLSPGNQEVFLVQPVLIVSNSPDAGPVPTLKQQARAGVGRRPRDELDRPNTLEMRRSQSENARLELSAGYGENKTSTSSGTQVGRTIMGRLNWLSAKRRTD